MLLSHRVRFAIRPLAYWTVVAALAVAAGVAVHRIADTAARARDRWGASRAVIVALRAIPPGGALDLTNTESRRLPLAAVPDAALDHLGPGAVASQPIDAGEVVVHSRVGRGGLGPIAALLPPNGRAVALGGRGPRPPVHVGDHVDVVAIGGDGHQGELVARAALVVQVDDQSVVVAVTAAELPGVAAAALDGSAVIAITGSATPAG